MYTNVLTNLLLLTVSCLPVKGNGNRRSALEFCAVLKLIVEDIAVYAIKIFAILFFQFGTNTESLFSLLYFAGSAEIEIKFLILVSCCIVYSILRF